MHLKTHHFASTLGFPGSAGRKRGSSLAAEASSFSAHPLVGNTGPGGAREQVDSGALTAVKAGEKTWSKFNYFRDDLGNWRTVCDFTKWNLSYCQKVNSRCQRHNIPCQGEDLFRSHEENQKEKKKSTKTPANFTAVCFHTRCFWRADQCSLGNISWHIKIFTWITRDLWLRVQKTHWC